MQSVCASNEEFTRIPKNDFWLGVDDVFSFGLSDTSRQSKPISVQYGTTRSLDGPVGPLSIK